MTETKDISSQIERRKVTPPKPADFVRGDIYGRPGVALPPTGESKPEEKEKPETKKKPSPKLPPS